MSKILALDYGLKRTGVAVTDDAKIFAFGVGTTFTKDLWKYLEGYFLQNKIELLVLGEPKRLNNEATHSTAMVNEFAQKFQEKYPAIPIKMVDERFTSKMASKSMIEMGMKKKDRQKKELVDEISAVIILQSYLSSIGNSQF